MPRVIRENRFFHVHLSFSTYSRDFHKKKSNFHTKIERETLSIFVSKNGSDAIAYIIDQTYKFIVLFSINIKHQTLSFYR